VTKSLDGKYPRAALLDEFGRKLAGQIQGLRCYSGHIPLPV
jgi:hypothetical protein